MATLTVLQRSPADHGVPEALTEEAIERIRREGGPEARMLMAAMFTVAAERGLMTDGKRVAPKIGPQTDEELLDAVERLTGYHIPRVAVCTEHGHKSPAQ